MSRLFLFGGLVCGCPSAALLGSCLRRIFVKKSAITSGGESLLQVLIGTPTRRGPTFVRTKVGKIRLGLCPKTPVAGCAGYGLIFDGSRKSIRTAHRIAPKVACGSICPFPPPPFPMRERGSDGRAIRNRQQRSRGVRACRGGGSRWLGCGTAIGRKMSRRPMVMVSGAGGLQEKGGRSPPPKRGRLGGGRCICDTL